MQCDCCGKKKKLFESYALVQTKYGSLNLCVKCNDIAYKVRDDANDMNIDEFQNHIDEWEKRSKKPSEKFLKWREDFLKPLKTKIRNSKKTIE